MAKAMRTIQPMGQTKMVSVPNKRVQTANENKPEMPNTAKSRSNCQRRTIEGISAKRHEKKYAVPKGAPHTSNTSRSRLMRRYSRLSDSKPPQPIHIWHLDAATNFYLATSFLKFYGNIRVGQEGNDRKTRFYRILYDFTCRDINLSSLEMLYCSIFEPDPNLAKETEGDLYDSSELGVLMKK